MKLTEKLATTCTYKGKKYKLDLRFNNVLKAYEILDDDVLLPFEKAQFFINTICKTAYKIPFDDVLDFTNFVTKTYINEDNRKAVSGEKTVDMTKDASYIYASFKQAYNLDLQKDTVLWGEFIALFQSLPENTKIREIMSIRAKPIPPHTKYNSAEIQNLIKLKEFYALVTPKSGENLKDGFKNLFETLKKRAVKGGE